MLANVRLVRVRSETISSVPGDAHTGRDDSGGATGSWADEGEMNAVAAPNETRSATPRFLVGATRATAPAARRPRFTEDLALGEEPRRHARDGN